MQVSYTALAEAYWGLEEEPNQVVVGDLGVLAGLVGHVGVETALGHVVRFFGAHVKQWPEVGPNVVEFRNTKHPGDERYNAVVEFTVCR